MIDDNFMIGTNLYIVRIKKFKGSVFLLLFFADKELTVSNNPPMLNPMMGPPGGMMMPPWNPMMNPMGMGDPMMMWGAWGPIGPIGMGPEPLLPQAQHEVITLKGAILYPPPPSKYQQCFS